MAKGEQHLQVGVRSTGRPPPRAPAAGQIIRGKRAAGSTWPAVAVVEAGPRAPGTTAQRGLRSQQQQRHPRTLSSSSSPRAPPLLTLKLDPGLRCRLPRLLMAERARRAPELPAGAEAGRAESSVHCVQESLAHPWRQHVNESGASKLSGASGSCENIRTAPRHTPLTCDLAVPQADLDGLKHAPAGGRAGR